MYGGGFLLHFNPAEDQNEEEDQDQMSQIPSSALFQNIKLKKTPKKNFKKPPRKPKNSECTVQRPVLYTPTSSIGTEPLRGEEDQQFPDVPDLKQGHLETG